MASKHTFLVAERWAVFAVHGPTCYLCGKPIDFTSMEVDHILPERLLDEPDELAAAYAEFSLGPAFDINSFANWLPACGPCNGRKSGTTFVAMPIIAVQLSRASSKSAEARRVAKQTISDRKIGNALAQLMLALTAGDLDLKKLEPLVSAYLSSHPEARAALREERDEKSAGMSRWHLGLQMMPKPILELPLTPFAKVVYWASGVAELVLLASQRPQRNRS